MLDLYLFLVGEYYFDFIVEYGVVLVIVLWVVGVDKLFESFKFIYGVFFCEGEDIDFFFYELEILFFLFEEFDEIWKIYVSDVVIDKEKDFIEFVFVKLCFE